MMDEKRRILQAEHPHKEFNAVRQLRSRDAVRCYKYPRGEINHMRGIPDETYFPPPPPLIRLVGTNGTPESNEHARRVNTEETQRVLQRTMIRNCMHVVKRREHWRDFRATLTLSRSVMPDTIMHIHAYVCEEY